MFDFRKCVPRALDYRCRFHYVGMKEGREKCDKFYTSIFGVTLSRSTAESCKWGDPTLALYLTTPT